MKITFLVFGKLKNPGMLDAFNYYCRCIGRYTEVEVVELRSEKVENKSANERRRIQDLESEKLSVAIQKLRREKSKICHFVLDELGKELNSLEWADLFSQKQLQAKLGNNGSIIFTIGSSLGISAEIKKQAEGLISLGKATLPHELARVVLAEQIFRALSILAKHPYHNEGS